jgi:RNA polymerase sigma-70 factor (ECF subfamily)
MAGRGEDTEAAVRVGCARGDYRAATTAALRGYGGELVGFLASRLRDASLVADAFAEMCEDLWRGLPGFAWRSSVRVWAYTLARHAALRVARAPHRRRDRNVSLSDIGIVSELAAGVRTETAAYLRTEVKDRFRRLRERLAPDDQTLLVLRIDKGLAWRELALVMAGEGVVLDDDGLVREAARLRKRFQTVKERLRELARAEGLLGGGEPERWPTKSP